MTKNIPDNYHYLLTVEKTGYINQRSLIMPDLPVPKDMPQSINTTATIIENDVAYECSMDFSITHFRTTKSLWRVVPMAHANIKAGSEIWVPQDIFALLNNQQH